MDNGKIIKLNIKQQNTEKEQSSEKMKKSLFQTNPLLKKMFFANIDNRKNKFSIKDLFR